MWKSVCSAADSIAIEDAPVVLHDAAVGRAVADECGDFRAVAADAEAANRALCDGVVEEIEQCGLCKVGGFRFVQQQQVNLTGAQIPQATFHRGAGLVGSELGLGGRCDGGAGGTYETLECGEALQERADGTTSSADKSGASGRLNAELSSDGDVTMVRKEFADARFSFAVAVKRRDVEVADACVVRGVQQAEALAAGDAGHQDGTAESEPGCLAPAGCEPDLLHEASVRIYREYPAAGL